LLTPKTPALAGAEGDEKALQDEIAVLVGTMRSTDAPAGSARRTFTGIADSASIGTTQLTHSGAIIDDATECIQRVVLRRSEDVMPYMHCAFGWHSQLAFLRARHFATSARM
jgi:hypothetical protein